MSEVIKPKANFNLFFTSVKAAEDNGNPVVYVTASSDEVDLATDRFSMSALKRMEATFPSMTIFLNHKYAVPEDVFGQVKSAQLVKREGHNDLDLEIEVETNNERAMQTYSMIKGGRVLGVSVGVIVTAARYSDEEVNGRKVLEITDVATLEASIVGIPANRRSWVRGALKAAGVFIASGVEEDTEELLKTLGMNETPVSDDVIEKDGADADADSSDSTEAEAVVASSAEADGDVSGESADSESDDEDNDADDSTEESVEGETVEASWPDFATIQKSFKGEAMKDLAFDALYNCCVRLFSKSYRIFYADGEVISSKDKKDSITTLITEFSEAATEVVGMCLDAAAKEEKDDAQTDQKSMTEDELLAHYFRIAKSAEEFDAEEADDISADDLAALTAAFGDFSKLTEVAKQLDIENKALAAEVETLKSEVAEKQNLADGLYQLADALMDIPLLPKTASEETVKDLSERFPDLAPGVLTILSRSNK